jgi:hypothetical protein
VIEIAAVIDASALQIVPAVLTGWLNRREREVISYLVAENRLLRRQLRGQRLRLTDDDRRGSPPGQSGWAVRHCNRSPRL